jgi:lipopolysaccharide transport system ATP-binding protein
LVAANAGTHCFSEQDLQDFDYGFKYWISPMSDLVIRVDNLGKKYRIHHQQPERYTALRDVIANKARGLFRLGRRGAEESLDVEDFWALKNLSFEVKRGEVVGIIGRNGAGKSTLLKILSRITEPSAGRVELYGRVASLLEVGTGFHPELTGRENIFLNGAILGMSRVEIKRKFDEIVAFAEIEKFLDTPVKRYSSGMYVRLAFAIAAHMEPEILVVDEVLAVGDAEFQRKCLGKMRDVSRGGRTVLFVSHNIAAVQALCGSAIVLDQGQLVIKSIVEDAVARYLHSDPTASGSFGSVALSKSITLTRLDATPSVIRRNDQIIFTLQLHANVDEVITDLMLEIYLPGGQLIAIVDLRSVAGPYRLRSGAKLVIRSQVSNVPFVEADFNLALYINANSACRSFMNLLTFTVLPAEAIEVVVPREPRFRGIVDLSTQVEATML